MFGRGERTPVPEPRSAWSAPAPAHRTTGHDPLQAGRAQALTDAQAAFLLGLNEPPEAQALDDLSHDDRAFIAGIQRRVRTRELDLPVLPEMAVRISRMLREGAAVSEFVTLLNRDASLSVEVLRAANSAYYAAARPLTNLQDAIVRIGLNRLQSLLMLSQLRGKVLKGGVFRAEADLLLELALPLGHLASKVARGHDGDPEMCFMRGALMHVEHLVILGTTAAVSRDVKRAILPSSQALHQAFVRFGPEIREAVAKEWHLTDLLLGGEGDTSMTEEYALLRRVLICRWLGLRTPAVAFTVEGLPAAMDDIYPRVPRGSEFAPRDEPPIELAG